METSARRIWILSQPDRGERIERALRGTTGAAKRFLKIEDSNMSKNERFQPEFLAINREHQRKQAELVTTLKGLLHEQVTVSVTRPDWPVWS